MPINIDLKWVNQVLALEKRLDCEEWREIYDLDFYQKITFQNHSIYQYLMTYLTLTKSLRHRVTYQIHLFVSNNKR